MTTKDRILIALACLALIAFVAELAHGQTQVAPEQLRAPRVSVFTCTKAPTAAVPKLDAAGNPVLDSAGNPVMVPGSNCAGLYYIDVVTPAGQELKIVGTVNPTAVNAADWSLVP